MKAFQDAPMRVSLKVSFGLAAAFLLAGCADMNERSQSMKTGTGPCHLENTCTGPGNAVDLSGLPTLVMALGYVVSGAVRQSSEADWDAARRVTL
jgi:hypothetical protein